MVARVCKFFDFISGALRVYLLPNGEMEVYPIAYYDNQWSQIDREIDQQIEQFNNKIADLLELRQAMHDKGLPPHSWSGQRAKLASSNKEYVFLCTQCLGIVETDTAERAGLPAGPCRRDELQQNPVQLQTAGDQQPAENTKEKPQ